MGENSFLDALTSLERMNFCSPPRGEPTDGVSPFADRTGQYRSMVSGGQWRFTFANGYGASVVRHSGSYGGLDGLWELAVIGKNGRLAYETPITDDVIGHLTEDDVVELLERIEALNI